jgi:ABC-2 type transport system permease protein
VVAVLISLKLHLLRGSLRGSLSQQIGLVIGILCGLSAVGICGTGLVALRFVEPDVAHLTVVTAGSLLVLGWVVVPLLIAGVDETLDPARFALLPVPARRLVPGLLLSGLLGVPGIVTSLLSAATLVTWARGPLPLLLAVPSALLGTVTCVLGARLVTTAACRMLSSRRFRETGAALAVLGLASVGLLPLLLPADDARAYERVATVLAALGWTPMGLAWAGPGDAATGHLGRGVLRLALAAALVALGVYLWTRLLDRALLDVSGGSGGARGEKAGASAFGRFVDRPVLVVTARCLRYWRRDPRYWVAVASVIISSAVLLAVGRSSASGDLVGVGIGPFVGILLGVATANDIGLDGSAFAAHLLIGVRGRTDRLGRALAATAVGLPVVVAMSVTGVLASGRGWLWPAALGTSLAGLLAGVGCSAIASSLVPYPAAEAGSSPFRGSSGGGARAVFAQLAVLSAASGLAVPPAVLMVLALVWTPSLVWACLIVGLVTGTAAVWAGVEAGGTIMDRRGPEILAAVRRSS